MAQKVFLVNKIKAERATVVVENEGKMKKAGGLTQGGPLVEEELYRKCHTELVEGSKKPSRGQMILCVYKGLGGLVADSKSPEDVENAKNIERSKQKVRNNKTEDIGDYQELELK